MNDFFIELCRARNIKLTAQRLAILRAINAPENDHPSIAEICDRARAYLPSLNLSTVYRSVKLLCAKGVLETHDFQSDMPRYGFTANHHDHLVDTVTKEIIEFENSELEALQRKIAKDLGYEPQVI